MYKIKPAFWILLSYFTYTYYAPLLFSFFFDLEIFSYKTSNLKFSTSLIFTLVFLFYSFIFSLSNKRYVFNVKKIKEKYLYRFLNVLLVFIVLGVFSGINSFRYLSTEIGSSDDKLIIILFSISTALSQLIFFYIFFYDFKLFYKKKYKLLFFLIFIFTINGIASTLFFLFTSLIFIFPKTVIPLISSSKVSFKTYINFILITAIIIFIANYLLSFAISVKQDKKVSEINLSEEVYLTSNYVNDRFSAHLYSYLINLSDKTYDYDVNKSMENFNNIFLGFKYRFSKTLGINSKKPKFGTVARTNFEKINYYTWLPAQFIINKNTRAGTAPGFLGSFFLMFSFPFNFLTPFIFFFMFSYVLNRIVQSSDIKLNFFGYLFITYFFLSFFLNNPFDFLLIFDETFIQLLIILFFLKFNVSKNYIKI